MWTFITEYFWQRHEIDSKSKFRVFKKLAIENWCINLQSTKAANSATKMPLWKQYSPPPQMSSFVSLHSSLDRRICLVTSGGTTVPFEKNTVRFLDNFSQGTRGAASAEQFLEEEEEASSEREEGAYAVVFLHRQGSLRPFRRWVLGAEMLF